MFLLLLGHLFYLILLAGILLFGLLGGALFHLGYGFTFILFFYQLAFGVGSWFTNFSFLFILLLLAGTWNKIHLLISYCFSFCQVIWSFYSFFYAFYLLLQSDVVALVYLLQSFLLFLGCCIELNNKCPFAIGTTSLGIRALIKHH